MKDAAAASVREALERHGLLPAHDPAIPSVSNIVAGRPIRGSWWGDPAGRQIYLVLNQFGEEAAWTKLLGGKVTLVHRRLWTALAVIGEQRSPWQVDGLTEIEQAALDVVDKEKTIKSDSLGVPSGTKPGKVVTELERRMLVIAEQEHTEGSHHERTVQTWATWLSEDRPPLSDAMADIEAAAESLTAVEQLPWKGQPDA